MRNKNIFLVKFTTAALMLGLFSPSIHIEQTKTQSHVKISVLQQAEARRAAARTGNRSVNKNRNTNRNVNRNVNKNVNVNVNHNNRYYGGHGRYGHYHGHPILAFTTVLAIGSIISAATMPKTCTSVLVNGIDYRRCDNSYYQPFYEGDTLVYKVVESPY